MSGWIKWGKGLEQKPEVFRMARKLGVDRYSVAGRLMAVWAWCDENVTLEAQQNRNGSVTAPVRMCDVDDIAAIEGFAEAMVDCGWLDRSGEDVVFPNFERHNGNTAKQRSLGSNRMQKVRGGVTHEPSHPLRKCDDASATKASPDKIREDKRREEDKPPVSPKGEPTRKVFDPLSAEIPQSLDTPEFRASWAEWVAYRNGVPGKKLKQQSWLKQLRAFEAAGVAASVWSINQSIQQGWTGVFPDKHDIRNATGFRPKDLNFDGLREFAAGGGDDGSF